jgi:foldase protein PrsA
VKSRRLGISLLALVTVVGVALSGCTSTLGYAAVVNGTAISQTKLNQELADIAANKQYVQLIDQPGGSGPVAGSTTGTYNKAFVALLLDQQVRFEIIRQQLAAAKALPTADQVNAAKATVTQAFPTGVYTAFPARYQNLLASQQAEADAFVKTVATSVSPDALNTYYQSHQSDYTTEACVRVILIADKDSSGQLDYNASLIDANKVKGLLDAGGDFAALAKQYSQDNQGTTGGSAAQGGMLTGSATDGCLTTSDVQQLNSQLPTLAQAVLSVPVNQVGAPVKTVQGYNLVEVTKRTVEPLDPTVTADIQQRLAGDRLNTLVTQSKVKVNPEFGTFNNKANAAGQVPGVTPPLVPNVSGPTTTSPPAPAAAGASSSGG